MAQQPIVSSPSRNLWPFTSSFYDPIVHDGTRLWNNVQDYLQEDYSVEHTRWDGIAWRGWGSKLTDLATLNEALAIGDDTRSPVQLLLVHRLSEKDAPPPSTAAAGNLTWSDLLGAVDAHPDFAVTLNQGGLGSALYSYSPDGKIIAMHLVDVFQRPDMLSGVITYFYYDFRKKRTVGILFANATEEGLLLSTLNRIEKIAMGHLCPISLTLHLTSLFISLLMDQVNLDGDRVPGIDFDFDETSQNLYDGSGSIEGDYRLQLSVRGRYEGCKISLEMVKNSTTYLASCLEHVDTLLEKQGSLGVALKQQTRLLQERARVEATRISSALSWTALNTRLIDNRLQALDYLINLQASRYSKTSSEQSMNIAYETRKDSTSMKTIAGLTMVYLPSTFAATLFSMGFFEFEKGILSVSVEIWKYIVICLVLTSLTALSWIWLNKRGIPKPISFIRDIMDPSRRRKRKLNSDTTEAGRVNQARDRGLPLEDLQAVQHARVRQPERDGDLYNPSMRKIEDRTHTQFIGERPNRRTSYLSTRRRP